MKTIFGMLVVLAIANVGFAQYQVNPQVNTQTGPVYPTTPSPYSFRSVQTNSPYLFNWYTGRWDYYPVPSSSAYPTSTQSNLGSGQTPPGMPSSGNGLPGAGAVPANQPVPAQNSLPSPSSLIPSPTTQPDAPMPQGKDNNLWSPPTTQPDTASAAPVVSFTGKIVGMRAMLLNGDPEPHLLVRLKSDQGAMGTVDVGDKMSFAGLGLDAPITVHGHLGDIDGQAVLFADQVTVGNRVETVDRTGT
jgi:hypothetical protein